MNPLPAVPTISQDVDTLTSSSPLGNQWYLNSVIIPGAVNQDYVANQTGNYTVVVTDSNGCSSVSAPYAYVYTLVGSPVGGSLFTAVYPNPVADQSALLIHAEGMNGNAQYFIYDLAGRVVAQSAVTITDGEARVNLNSAEFAEGTYVYSVQLTGGATLNGRFVIQ